MIASAGIAHRNIRPETVLIDGSKVIITEFAHATVVATESHTIQAEFVIDRHMLACTILYTLAGGRGADHRPLDFDELMEATEAGFDDPRLFLDLLCVLAVKARRPGPRRPRAADGMWESITQYMISRICANNS